MALSSARLAGRLSRRIEAVDLRVVMIDGIHFRGRAVLIARDFNLRGNKHALGIRQGSTEKGRWCGRCSAN